MEKKLYEALGTRRVAKQKLRSGLRNGKKLKSTCRPPWLAQGQKKNSINAPPIQDGALVGFCIEMKLNKVVAKKQFV
jgi:hypothetical protein